MVTIFTPLVHHTIHLSPPIHQLYAGSAFGLTLPWSSHFISIIDQAPKAGERGVKERKREREEEGEGRREEEKRET
jgi:hypothetical protein